MGFSGPGITDGVAMTARAAMHNKVFLVLWIWNMSINFGINYLFEWGTLSNWGKQPVAAHMFVWKFIKVGKFTNTCIWVDLLCTSFIIAWISMLLGTGGSQKEVLKGTCPALSGEVLRKGVWKALPMFQKNVCLRSLIVGLEFTVAFGCVAVALLSVAISPHGMTGQDYVWFKSFFAAFQAAFVFPTVHFAATVEENLDAVREAAHRQSRSESGAVVSGMPIDNSDLETAPLIPGTGRMGRPPQFDTAANFVPPIVGQVPKEEHVSPARVDTSGTGMSLPDMGIVQRSEHKHEA